jgi:hypothetical protein
MLFYYDIPDKLLYRKEAVIFARDVLKKKPSSKAAKQVLGG